MTLNPDDLDAIMELVGGALNDISLVELSLQEGILSFAVEQVNNIHWRADRWVGEMQGQW